MAEEVRVRIAPSPSGNLHVGTARLALAPSLTKRYIIFGKIMQAKNGTYEQKSD